MKMLNSFLALVVSGRVDQLGMIATLASSRSRVQIPPRPLKGLGLRLFVDGSLSIALLPLSKRFRIFLKCLNRFLWLLPRCFLRCRSFIQDCSRVDLHRPVCASPRHTAREQDINYTHACKPSNLIVVLRHTRAIEYECLSQTCFRSLFNSYINVSLGSLKKSNASYNGFRILFTISGKLFSIISLL